MAQRSCMAMRLLACQARARSVTDRMKHSDTIIVGAGSAGCVLANRLTANGRHRVLVLEAGPADRNPWIHVPIGYGKLFNNRRVNWCYESEPEPELLNRRVFTPRGKVLGGSSSINGLVYIRGQAQDFDQWNIPGWGFTDLLPYFKKSEHQSRGADAYHGVDGPLAVSDLPDKHPLCDAFIDSAVACGIPRNDDFNGAEQEGTGYYQATVKHSRRCSAAGAYLKPVRSRQNLTVVTNALVVRLLFEGKRACGVEYIKNGKHVKVQAGEIIVAGGAINSPQLLQLSGIGDADLLQHCGVPVVHHSPLVGQRLQDHYYVRTTWRCNQPITINDQLRTPFGKAKQGLRWLLQGRGSFTVSAGYAGAFVRTQERIKRPDAQLYFINFSASKPGAGLDRFSGFTTSVSQLRAESSGSVLIKTSDPRQPPVIRYNFMSTEEDRRVMVDGLRVLRDICTAEPLNGYVDSEIAPGKSVVSDQELLRYCREVGGTVYHPVATCHMGNEDSSVVDASLRVRGVDGLRVIDASVMPTVISGNTNAATIAIAEKGADIILAESRPD